MPGAQAAEHQPNGQRQRAQRSAAAGGPHQQKHADGKYQQAVHPAHLLGTQQGIGQYQAEHQSAECVGVAVAVSAAQSAHPLAGQVRGNDPGKVQCQHHRHGGTAAGKIDLQRAAQGNILGGKHRHHNADPPDVLAVEIDPAGNEIQRSASQQLPPGVAGAEQNLGTKAQEREPFQHGAHHALHPRPVLARHAVAEHYADLIRGQPGGKQNTAKLQSPFGQLLPK